MACVEANGVDALELVYTGGACEVVNVGQHTCARVQGWAHGHGCGLTSMGLFGQSEWLVHPVPAMEHLCDSVPIGNVHTAASIGARSTTSKRATVISPPMSGWCMFHASPRKMMPSLYDVCPVRRVGGMNWAYAGDGP